MEPKPVFTKKLTYTDICHRLSFPSDHLGILLQAASDRDNKKIIRDPYDPVEFQVSCGDEVRTFRCIKRRNGAPKPVIQSGWSGLVEDKGVQIGDELQFYMQVSDDEATRYWIKIYRYEYQNDEMGTCRTNHRIV